MAAKVVNMPRKQLLGSMGMFEMEIALDVMLLKATECGSTFGDVIVCPDDFEGQGLTGFCALLYYGWMVRGTYNGQYRPNTDLIERVHSGGVL